MNRARPFELLDPFAATQIESLSRLRQAFDGQAASATNSVTLFVCVSDIARSVCEPSRFEDRFEN
jgi:hypothetical protein